MGQESGPDVAGSSISLFSAMVQSTCQPRYTVSSESSAEGGSTSKLPGVGRIHFCVCCWTEVSVLHVLLKAALDSLPVDLSNMAAGFIKTCDQEGKRERLFARWASQLFVTLPWKWHPIAFAILIILLLLSVLGKSLRPAHSHREGITQGHEF